MNNKRRKEIQNVIKDIDADEQFGKYFSDGGIKKVESTTLSDL